MNGLEVWKTTLGFYSLFTVHCILPDILKHFFIYLVTLQNSVKLAGLQGRAPTKHIFLMDTSLVITSLKKGGRWFQLSGLY